MPASRKSVEISDAYRAALVSMYNRAGLFARMNWARVDPDNLDGTYPAFAAATVAAAEVLQRSGVALTSAYIAAYVASETGGRVGTPPAADDTGVGLAQHGAPLREAIISPLIGIKGAIKHDTPPEVALRKGYERASRLIQSAVLAAPRQALHAAIKTDERIVGWRRVTGGGCGACLAAATGAIHKDSEVLRVHSHCRCTAEPVVRDVQERVHRPTGFEMFNGLPAAQQDELLGQEKAQLVRSGAVPFERLVATDRMAVGPDQLVEAPLRALT
jgi:hypothetical protein